MLSDANSPPNTSRRGSKRAPNPWPFEPVRAIGFPNDKIGLGKMAMGEEFGAPSDGELIKPLEQSSFGSRRHRQHTPFGNDTSRDSCFFGESARTTTTKRRQRSQPRRSSRRSKHERTGFSSATNDKNVKETNNNNTEKQSAADPSEKYYSCYSYGANKLSERLSSGLKLDSPSPRGLTRNPIGRRSARFRESSPNEKTTMRQSKEDGSVVSTPSKQPIPEDTSTRLVIETRRTEIRDGNVCFEETFSISFPKILPPNVKIITVGQ